MNLDGENVLANFFMVYVMVVQLYGESVKLLIR